MDEAKATVVVERLRARGAYAHVQGVGVYEYAVQIVIPDGREAIWDADGAAGLEALVMRDGVPVGLIETIPGSEDFTVEQVVDAIAHADYDAPLPERPPSRRSAPGPTVTAGASAPPSGRPRGGLLRKLFGR